MMITKILYYSDMFIRETLATVFFVFGLAFAGAAWCSFYIQQKLHGHYAENIVANHINKR